MRMQSIHARNAHEAGLLGTAVWMIGRLSANLEYESPIQLLFHQSIIFINPTSTSITILSSILLPRSLYFYHQSCFHGHYIFIINPASTYNVMRQHIIARIPCVNPVSISVKEILSLLSKQ